MNNSLDEQRRIVAYLAGLPPTLRFGDLRQAKVNAFPLAALGDDVRELQSTGGAPKSVLREGVAPVFWADVDGIRVATAGSGRLRESCEAPSVRWTSPPNATIVLSNLGENWKLRFYEH